MDRNCTQLTPTVVGKEQRPVQIYLESIHWYLLNITMCQVLLWALGTQWEVVQTCGPGFMMLGAEWTKQVTSVPIGESTKLNKEKVQHIAGMPPEGSSRPGHQGGLPEEERFKRTAERSVENKEESGRGAGQRDQSVCGGEQRARENKR